MTHVQAPASTKRARKSAGNLSSAVTPVTTKEVAIRPATDLARPWKSFPTRDPFFDLFCEDEPEDTSPESAAPELSPPETSYTLLHSPAPAPDSDIPSGDLPYFRFFLAEMSNVLPYVNIFPSAVSSLFSSSIHHPALRHSVLSISALIADKVAHRGRERALQHLQKSLKLLQNSLSAVEVDEGVAISIFLLAYFNVSSGEHASARKHLTGLAMVMQQIQQDHMVRNGGVLSPYAISPLTMLVWRMAIRMDFIISILYAQRPIFPMFS